MENFLSAFLDILLSISLIYDSSVYKALYYTIIDDREKRW